ncbi:MAG: hypothetical protein K0R90_71 [Oscillospiraceae bacterium]|jgi:cell fate (sporulation/competence/biofilm development) regulator YlbF (YheA/YmcA/DUF963 family)|nr:hypothetical protein [Oscillospiraceae bacterium]
MEVIKMARELGKEIQKTEEYKNLNAAKAANDLDKELEDLIGKFNLKRIELNTEMGKQQKDEDKLKRLDKEINEVYSQIMSNKNMMAYNSAKQEMDGLMNQVSAILSMSVNGQDPDTCEVQSACGGSCSSCAGCH